MKIKTKKHSLLIVLCLLFSSSVFSQTDESHPEFDSVMQAINGWIETLETGDLSRRAELTIDGAIIQRLVQQEDGSFERLPRVRNIDTSASQQSVQIERFWDERVFINERMAVFWASYDFWVNGSFTHCGTDVFDLIKIDGEWKLGSMMYTIEKTGCPPSPLGEL
ncbi:MAG: hypothetical protein COB20_15530 [SAR86 cluster bacterium]|uniref:Nuclear transport factor 2 family protein n=1 Tax=SAR86 cluster bacterium TaxID=2030880 RepID=A0A2A4WUI1_9GAMM|nr:MAG: hypothetical protein COB20_15530 [SAR86 cluster bacterium]